VTRWPTATIGSACTVFSGGTPSKGNAAYWHGTIPWVSAKDLKADRIFDAELHISQQACDESAAKMAPVGSLLMLVRGMGLANGIQVGQVTAPVAFNQDLRAIVPPPGVDSRFLLLALRHRLADGGKGVLSSAAHGTLKIDADALRQVEFPVPPPHEQRRIVAILDEAFVGIATAKANAEKSLQNAREIFESRLRSLVNEEAAGSDRKTLREIAIDFGRGKSKHRPRNNPKLYGGPYPFIQTGDVRGSDHLITDFAQTYSDAGLAQSKLWPKGTLCITIAANIAETGVLGFDACFPDSVIGVVVDERQTSSKYLEYMLQTVKAELKAKGKGSAQDNINLATFENERFPFPDLGAQARIVESLDALATEIQRLEATYANKLAALDELKRSLLHQAFSGGLS
jgi:type I restriction enzyme S subunit